MHTHSPTVRRKYLSNALRQLRKDAGMTADEAARHLSWDPSKLSRMESNQWKLPRLTDIEKMCDVYGVTEQHERGVEREALITLARQARERGWWEQYKDVLGGALPGLEAEARRIWQYQPTVIPGLLQTRDYMRAVFRAGEFDEPAVERRTAARQARQWILDADHPLHLWAVIDEGVLRRMVGGREVMRDQVHHLLTMSDRPKIGIQILPDHVGAHALMGGALTLLDYTGERTIVYLETVGTGDVFLEGTDEVMHCTVRYDHVMASALSVELSRAYLESVLEDLKGDGS